MTSMYTRILTAVIAIPLLIGVLLVGELNHWVVTVVVSLATAFMTCEFLTAQKSFDNLKISVPCIGVSLIMPLLAETDFWFVPFYLYILVIFAILIFCHKTVTFREMAFCFTGTIIITAGMSSINWLIGLTPYHVAFFVLMALGVPWMADAGGYFAGVFFGKHKLCPTISPKKTVEGFIGGIVFCIAGAALLGVLFNFVFYKDVKINYLSLLLYGVLDSFISVLGDLSFSLIKRSCHIKDYGSIFPGHGGMLDRCDSVIFSAPLLLIIQQLIPIIS